MIGRILKMVMAVMIVISQTSFALAQNYHFNAFDHAKRDFTSSKINSRGLTGQLSFSIPLGAVNKNSKKPFYGFKMTYGKEMVNGDPFSYGQTRNINLFQSGVDKYGISSLQLAGQDLYYNGERKDFIGNGNGNGNGLLWGALLIGVGVGACWALGCFDGDEDSSGSSS